MCEVGCCSDINQKSVNLIASFHLLLQVSFYPTLLMRLGGLTFAVVWCSKVTMPGYNKILSLWELSNKPHNNIILLQ